jgi:hypothetical protein
LTSRGSIGGKAGKGSSVHVVLKQEIGHILANFIVGESDEIL